MSSTTTPRRRGLRIVVAVAALLLSACDPTPSGDAAPVANTAPAADTAPADTTSSASPSATAEAPAALVARASGKLDVYDGPGGTEPVRTLPATTTFGTPTVALVTDADAADGWLEVLLPGRPNGATGWVRAADVETRDVTLEVRVDLEDRELTVLDGGQELLSTPTAVGSEEYPTPTGRFYVVDKLETPDPGGAYGPYALGLSGRSDKLTDFGGGDGQIGIHGTNAPDSIGRAVSHGCLRVGNDVITELAQLLPLGTPVTIS